MSDFGKYISEYSEHAHKQRLVEKLVMLQGALKTTGENSLFDITYADILYSSGFSHSYIDTHIDAFQSTESSQPTLTCLVFART